MLKPIICYFLASLFLSGSIILPLGDFSLLRDIPAMYQNYTKICSEEEVGILDFIGDYLLEGKQILGHNKHDKIPVKGNEVQFQHLASPLNVVFFDQKTNLLTASFASVRRPLHAPSFYIGDYRNWLFRPPHHFHVVY